MAYLYITDTKGERREYPLPGEGGRLLIGGTDDCDVSLPESGLPAGRCACVRLAEDGCRILRGYSEEGSDEAGELMAEGENCEWEGLRLMWTAERAPLAEDAAAGETTAAPAVAPLRHRAAGASRNIGPLTMENVSSGGFARKEKVSPGYALAALVFIFLGLYFGMLSRQYQDTGRWSYSLFEKAR